MASGHIKLGVPGDLRDYALLDFRNYQASLANPFAANINTQSEFGALDEFSEWTQQDWRMGTGKRNPEEGGSLYAHMDTRFPEQMINPLGLSWPHYYPFPNNGSTYIRGDLTVDGTTITAASASFTAPSSTEDIYTLWVYVEAETGTTLTAAIYSDTGNQPNASVTSGTVAINPARPGPHWVQVNVTRTSLSTSTRYHVVLSADASLTFPLVSKRNGQFCHTYDGATWTSTTTGFQWFASYVTGVNNLGLEDGSGSLLMEDNDEFLLQEYGDRLGWIVKANGRLFGAYNNQMVELLDGTETYTSRVNTLQDAISDMVVVDDKVFIAHGSGYQVYDTDDNSTTVKTEDTSLFLVYGGYLWRTYQNDLYYTSDLATWTQITDTIGPDGYVVRGMAGMGEQVYLSTDLGLYTVMPGDFVYPIKKWPTTDARNGVGMIEWEGSLYIPLAEDLVRYTSDGQLIQVGLRTGEELPEDIQGAIYRLHGTSYFLLASVENTATTGHGSLWAYNSEGWHNLALLPQGVRGGAIYVDTATGYLYWGGSYGVCVRLHYPSSVVNPVRDVGSSLFARHGWLEQDRFYGGFVALLKDFESVYVDTEDNRAATIAVYWQDQDSYGIRNLRFEDDSGLLLMEDGDRFDVGGDTWQLLGSSSADDFTLRWSDYDTRPASRWIRFGLLTRTDEAELTPIIRAIRMSFHTMVHDRWQWQVSIPIHDDQQMLDGTLNPYTAAQQKAHLESLARNRVPPIIMEDEDGTQYEVKVLGLSKRMQQVEYYDSSVHVQRVYDLTMRQLIADEYTG